MIQYLYLGRIGYSEAFALQKEMVELRHQGRVDNVLLLLEHPPVLTLGRNSNRSNILATDALLAQNGVTVHEINRGGDVTYHGPGQLVGYPIFDLRSLTNDAGRRLGPVDYVRWMEEALIRLCAGYGVMTERIAGRTGVWTKGVAGGEKKVAAIGVHVSRGITSHGFALNVTTDLRDFQWIVPCGIADRDVTSLELEMRRAEELPALERVADGVARQFGLVFGQQVLAVAGVEDLRDGSISGVRPSEDSGPDLSSDLRPDLDGEIQQTGAPLRVPKEVEYIRNGSDSRRDGSARRPVEG